jgi:hypothetical protein
MATDTKITHLRSLANDHVRGLRCLAWAEQERHNYELGQRVMQDRRIAEAKQRLGRRFDAASEAEHRTQGNVDWAATPAADDNRRLAAMYTSWADTYFAANTSEMLGKMYHQSR